MSDQHAEGPPRDLGEDLGAFVHRLRGQVEQFAPQLGRRVDLQQCEGHRPADLLGEAPHPVEFLDRRRDVFARRTRASDLEDALAQFAQDATDPEQLVLGRERAGHGSPLIARCAIVREVEKPRAPAATPAFTISAMRAMSSAVAASLFAPRSPIT